MDLTIKVLPKGLLKITLFILLISIVSLSAFNVSGQKIYDELNKKKPASTSQPKEVKKRTPKKAVKVTKKAAPSTAKSKTKPKTVSQKQTRGKRNIAEIPKETTAQILERFMDFERSPSVTSDDWESILLQTNQELKKRPGNLISTSQHWLALAELAFINQDYAKARDYFLRSARFAPTFVLAYYGVGRVYLATKQPDQAEISFQKAVKLDDKFALGFNGLGKVMEAKGKSKKAEEYFNRAGEIVLRERNLTSPAAASASLPVVPSESATNKVTAAASEAKLARKTEEKVAAPVPTIGDETYVRELGTARQLMAQKLWQKSIDKLVEVSKIYQSYEVFALIGENYSFMKVWRSALQSYQRATEIDPNSAFGFYKAGKIYYELNEYLPAAEAFEKALILDVNGKIINRSEVRKLANKAKKKAEEVKSGE